LASFHFNKIELEHECKPELQFSDSVPVFESMLTRVLLPNLNHISKSILILMPVNLELESPILQNHILFLKNECKPDLHFFDLDPILEPISTPKLVLDLNQIFESVMVPELLTLEPINRLTKSYSIVG